jgi:hypothetical protein
LLRLDTFYGPHEDLDEDDYASEDPREEDHLEDFGMDYIHSEKLDEEDSAGYPSDPEERGNARFQSSRLAVSLSILSGISASGSKAKANTKTKKEPSVKREVDPRLKLGRCALLRPSTISNVQRFSLNGAIGVSN